jgi:two-component system nitrate/nitrite response regulator NarL
MTTSTNCPIRIVLLDEHVLVRAGLRHILGDQHNMEVVGEAGSIRDGLELVSNLKPDIILLELNLSGQADSEFIPSLYKASAESRIILVTGSGDPRVLQKVVEDGVVGVVFKSQSPEVLIKAIEKVWAGEVWLERSLIANVLTRLSRNQPVSQPDPELENFSRLSEREKEVVRLIGKGLKNKRISTELCISETTVRHHLTSIYNKLGVSDRLELLVYAHRYGLVAVHKQ